MLVAKKGTKEKLKEWYKRTFNKTKENDTVRKVLKTAGEVYSATIGAVLSIFAPEYSSLAPLARFQADVGLKVYDGVKQAADQAAGIDYKEDNTESTSYLNEEETKALAQISAETLGNLDKKTSTKYKEKTEETKGRSL